MTRTVFPVGKAQERRKAALEELANVDARLRSLALHGHDQTTWLCESLQEQVLRRRKLVRELRTLEKLVKRRVITGLESVLDSNGNKLFGVTGFNYESKYPEGHLARLARLVFLPGLTTGTLLSSIRVTKDGCLLRRMPVARPR